MVKRLVVVLTMLGASVVPVAASVGAHAQVPGTNGRIAYVTDSRGCDDCHVFTAEPDGSDRVKLTDDAVGGPRWSPDGAQLIFASLAPDGRVTTATIAADGTGFEVFDLPHATLNIACWGWSPDGTRLACETWDDTRPHRKSGVYTVNATDGQDPQRLTRNPYGSGDLTGDFSPDGSRYAFIRFNEQRRHGTVSVWVVDADGTGETRLTPWTMNACCGVSWSPDGQRILFEAGGTFYTMLPDGSDISEIGLEPGDLSGFAFDPSWSPDGSRIVFSMYVEADDQVDILTAAADGSDVVRVTDTGREDGFADWGPAAA